MSTAPLAAPPAPTCLACDAPLPAGAEFCSHCGARCCAASPDPLLGTVVDGRYRVLGLLGEGGMGAVYEAEQTLGSARRQVALKVLLPELSRDPALRQRFLVECGVLAGLSHPNVVGVYDFGVTADDRLYLVMELVKGTVLGDAASGPMGLERVVRIVAQIASALHAAHLAGIVHRDLKPENVLLTCRAGAVDTVKLLDFGIALEVRGRRARLTATGAVLGTPPYMSPEQIGGSVLDAQSDVYSLAVLTYELLTGHLPFAARNPWEWAYCHVHQAPLPFDTTEAGAAVPGAVRDVVLAGLAKEPERRPAGARAFARALADAGELEPSARAARSFNRAATAPMRLPVTVPFGATRGPNVLGAPLLLASAPLGSAPSAGAAVGGAPLGSAGPSRTESVLVSSVQHGSLDGPRAPRAPWRRDLLFAALLPLLVVGASAVGVGVLGVSAASLSALVGSGAGWSVGAHDAGSPAVSPSAPPAQLTAEPVEPRPARSSAASSGQASPALSSSATPPALQPPPQGSATTGTRRSPPPSVAPPAASDARPRRPVRPREPRVASSAQ